MSVAAAAAVARYRPNVPACNTRRFLSGLFWDNGLHYACHELLI